VEYSIDTDFECLSNFFLRSINEIINDKEPYSLQTSIDDDHSSLKPNAEEEKLGRSDAIDKSDKIEKLEKIDKSENTDMEEAKVLNIDGSDEKIRSFESHPDLVLIKKKSHISNIAETKSI